MTVLDLKKLGYGARGRYQFLCTAPNRPSSNGKSYSYNSLVHCQGLKNVYYFVYFITFIANQLHRARQVTIAPLPYM